MNTGKSQPEIAEILNAYEEWLLIESATGKSFALRRAEIEIYAEREKLIFGFLDETGFQTRRIENWKFEKGKLHFDLTRNFGKEHRKIELVSRVSVAELASALEPARIEKANRIAGLIIEYQLKAKLRRVALNHENGRFAQIIFETSPTGKQIAAVSDVSGEAATTPEKLLTTAVLWLEKLCNRKKNKVETIWILSEKKTAKDLMKLHALLRKNWQSKIKVFEVLRGAKGETKLAHLETTFDDLWREKPKKISAAAAVKNLEFSETARQICKLAPAEIDVVFTGRGETLRFSGLPFARVRKILGREKAWFGTESKRQILNAETHDEFLKLIENLRIYRRFASPNKCHAFYTLAPESWLESILRKNIKQLDANLILSPIHNQFRISDDRIDLLALRKDGRLVIIELKTSADREMIFQAAGYWRKVEMQRISGNLQKSKIFGEAKISDESALVYLAAPTLSFHRDFKFLAQMISPEIEIARFDLNENWRENLKVLGRKVISDR